MFPGGIPWLYKVSSEQQGWSQKVWKPVTFHIVFEILQKQLQQKPQVAGNTLIQGCLLVSSQEVKDSEFLPWVSQQCMYIICNRISQKGWIEVVKVKSILPLWWCSILIALSKIMKRLNEIILVSISNGP